MQQMHFAILNRHNDSRGGQQAGNRRSVFLCKFSIYILNDFYFANLIGFCYSQTTSKKTADKLFKHTFILSLFWCISTSDSSG